MNQTNLKLQSFEISVSIKIKSKNISFPAVNHVIYFKNLKNPALSIFAIINLKKIAAHSLRFTILE